MGPAIDRFERSLPHLPVPTLEETAARYIKSIETFHVAPSPSDSSTPLPTYAASLAAVEEFKTSPLVKTLQERLLKRAEEKRSWLSEWWNEAAYFGWRGPVVPGELRVHELDAYGGADAVLDRCQLLLQSLGRQDATDWTRSSCWTHASSPLLPQAH